MLFNSIQFLIFFPTAAILYFILNHKHRWILLLLSSYFFYISFKPVYAVLLATSTMVTYIAAILIEKNQESNKKKYFLWLCLAINLGLLFVFKYFNFFSASFFGLFKIFDWHYSPPVLRLLLPIGISFYTFQSLAYVFDVYRGKIKSEKHPGIYAAYVSFFPQLLAGPIGRAGDLLPQFFEKHDVDYVRIAEGLKLMAWGMFKKIVVADGIALFVNRVYDNLNSYSGLPLLLATVFFSFQIYCDFSGYSDIAIGAAKVLGFKLMDNFKAPYLAQSVADFWRRWHISLSSWFQDYVFSPLYFFIHRLKHWGRVSVKFRHLLSFVVSLLIGESLLGLWHGANWTYVLFGLYHGFFIILYYLVRRYWDKMFGPLQVILTFVITTVAWIFFRAKNLSESWYILTHIFVPSVYGNWHDFRSIFLHEEYEFAILLVPLAVVISAHFIEKKRGNILFYLNGKTRIFRWVIYCLLITMIFLFGTFGSKEFIYFNF